MPHCVVHDTTEQRQTSPIAGDQAACAIDASSAAELDAAIACAALELVASVGDAAKTDAAAVHVANRLRTFLAADGVAVGLVQRGCCRLAAVAGAADVNRGSELSLALERALAEEDNGGRRRGVQDVLSAPDTAITSASPRSGESIGDRRLGALLSGAASARCQLITPSGLVVGALLVWGNDPEFDRPQTRRFLRLAGEPLAVAFNLLDRARQSAAQRLLGRVARTRWWLPWTAAGLLALGVTFLLPYRIACDCAAEPRLRRFVAAPFAGVLEKSFVRPGDAVSQGQLLGQIDGRELRLELAAITADYDRVRKSHDVNLAAGKVAAAQIDRLELERLDQKRQLLDYRMANLDLRSPVAGFVIGGDLKRTEGAPLTVGQVLYEIAPLDQMIVEVAIDDDDIAQVSIDQAVSIRFEAYAGESFVGRLARIHPRSETRDSRNVFIGEVVLGNVASELRPGMQGKARMVVENESLATGLWTRSWHAVAMFFGS